MSGATCHLLNVHSSRRVLEDHGFDRSAVMASLALHKGNLSTMIAVARALPEQLIVAIGAAPKIGRPRWSS